MKSIKGKKYYVCLGYVDNENVGEEINVRDTIPIYMKEEYASDVVYVDDSDKDNVVVLPLIPVNEIQAKGFMYRFRILVDPYKMNYDENPNPNRRMLRSNIIILFAVYEENGTQVIQYVSSYKVKSGDKDSTMYFQEGNSSVTLSIEAHKNKILGDN